MCQYYVTRALHINPHAAGSSIICVALAYLPTRHDGTARLSGMLPRALLQQKLDDPGEGVIGVDEVIAGV